MAHGDVLDNWYFSCTMKHSQDFFSSMSKVFHILCTVGIAVSSLELWTDRDGKKLACTNLDSTIACFQATLVPPGDMTHGTLIENSICPVKARNVHGHILCLIDS